MTRVNPDLNDDRPKTPAAYEPPKVERVLSAEDLAREVQYAGSLSFDTSEVG